MDRRLKTLITLATVLIILPFVGIPVDWKGWVMAIVGLAIVALSWHMRKDLPGETKDDGGPPFEENGNTPQAYVDVPDEEDASIKISVQGEVSKHKEEHNA